MNQIFEELGIESKGKREKKRRLWESFEKIKSQETFLFLYLLHKPDYPYNIASTLIGLRKKKILKLEDFKTLLRAGEVASKLSKMEGNKFVVSKEEYRRGKSKTYDINLNIFLQFFFYNEDKEESGNITVLLNILDLYRSLVKSANQEKIWLREIEKFRKYDHFTVLCYLVDKIVEPIGGVYRNLKQNEDYWRDYYLRKITVIKNRPPLKEQLIKEIEKIGHKKEDVPKLKENLTSDECIHSIYDIQHRLLEIMESSIGVERGFEPKFTFFGKSRRNEK